MYWSTASACFNFVVQKSVAQDQLYIIFCRCLLDASLLSRVAGLMWSKRKKKKFVHDLTWLPISSKGNKKLASRSELMTSFRAGSAAVIFSEPLLPCECLPRKFFQVEGR